MPKLSSGQEAQRRLTENITLLWTLCETPEQPKENQIREGYDQGRQLPRNRETQLADSLAFISATTDDMRQVMALCIEEDPDKTGMTIRLASNTGDLSLVTEGFNGIARTLEQASLRAKSRTDIQQDLFRQIVLLDEPRILSRLRSRHAARTRRTIGKPELLPLLSSTVHDKSIYSRDEAATARITRIQISSEELSQNFSDFQIARDDTSTISVSRDMLINLLIRINEFDVRGLEAVLGVSSAIQIGLKTSLLEKMNKLGHYYRVACDLIDAARSSKYTLFRSIAIRTIEKPHLDMAFVADPSVGFDGAVQRVTRSSHQRLVDAYKSRSVSAARKKFSSCMYSGTTSWKVHAEIQLLLFYEQQPYMSHPRTISSSKSACYLCDLFIQLHGEFHTPRTHGRLYEKWTLPERTFSELAANQPLFSVIQKFNAAVEAKILHTLTCKPQPFLHPNESVLGSRQSWSSNSTLPGPCKQGSVGETADLDRNDSPRGQAEPGSNISPFHLLSPTTFPGRDEPGVHNYTDRMQPDMRLMNPVEVFRSLSRGDSTCCKLIIPRDTLTVQTGPMIIHASWDSNIVDAKSDPSAPHRACWVQVEWLTDDGQTAHDDTNTESIDIDSVARNCDTVVEGGAALSSKELALKIGADILLVKYTFVDPTDTQGK